MKKTKSLAILLGLLVSVSGTALADNYGVIFSGGHSAVENYNAYYVETLRMWGIMTGPLWYDVDKVYVLFADGTAPGDDRNLGTKVNPVYANSDWSMITDAGGNIEPATKTNLMNRLLGLQTLIQPDDCFHFWSFDHGFGQDGTESPAPGLGGLVAWGSDPWIDDDVFAGWVNPINAYAESYAFAQCYGGDMVDDLNILPGENRFAAWAAAWWETSTTCDYGAYTEGWADAWADGLYTGRLRWTRDLGRYAVANDPFAPPGRYDKDGVHYIEHPGWLGDNFHIVTNEPIPAPAAFVLGSIGLAFSGWKLRRRREL